MQRFKRASIRDLRAQYLFALGHICHQDITKPMRLGDFFQLIISIDQYIEEAKRG